MMMGWRPWVCITLEKAPVLALARRLTQEGQYTQAALEDRLQPVPEGPHLSRSIASRGKQAPERESAA